VIVFDWFFGEGSAGTDHIPVVAADPSRDAIFAAAHNNATEGGFNGVAVMRSSSATLLNHAACPDGTHTPEQTRRCWPTRRALFEGICTEAGCSGFAEGVMLAVDERASGGGAGNVYVGTKGFRFVGPEVLLQGLFLQACTNDLQLCSPELVISDDAKEDPFAFRSLRMTVRPDGDVVVTYIFGDDIRYVRCQPASRGAPESPICVSPVTVHHETRGLSTAAHAHRRDANGMETYVVWDRCAVIPAPDVPCPETDVVMKASNDDGVTWSPNEAAPVATAAGSQFDPSIVTDLSRQILKIAYYSSEEDLFKHRTQVFVRHILPGSATPDAVTDAQEVTTRLTEGGGFGLGLASRGAGQRHSRTYIHHNSSSTPGIYDGVPLPDQNNHLSRFDARGRQRQRDSDAEDKKR
jgi:hypothetical protein